MKAPHEYNQYKQDLCDKLDFDFREGRSLLDVGCGDCTDLEIFTEDYGLNACGIEVSRHRRVDDLQVDFTLGSALDYVFSTMCCITSKMERYAPKMLLAYNAAIARRWNHDV